MGKCIELLCVILITFYKEAVPEKTAQVEVRAVLISCEPDNEQSLSFDSEAMRFEREELFKHSVLRDCYKKIALTVKITSDPDQSSGDEYIPIEHVFQGPKKVRLLNPYVLRLRRELPLQAYKLRKIDTVSGSVAKEMASRVIRNIKSHDEQNLLNSSKEFSQDSESCERFTKLCRSKRQENSIEGNSKNAVKVSRDRATAGFASDLNELMNTEDVTAGPIALDDDNMLDESVNFDTKMRPEELPHSYDFKPVINDIVLRKTKKPKPYEVRTKIDWPSDLDESKTSNQIMANKEKGNIEVEKDKEKEYDMYEIGNADMWYTIQVQLFEKQSTPDGKTAWNDLTKGKPARVSSLSPEWTGQDMSILYKSSEWIPREELTLPATSMCLLAPVSSKTPLTMNNDDHRSERPCLIWQKGTVWNPVGRRNFMLSNKRTSDQYLLVPREDVVGLQNYGNNTNKRQRDDNLEASMKQDEQSLRRVMIRTSRALLSGVADKVSIVNIGGDQFLTLVHKKPYHAQIDLESRADENQLVYVGSSGRIMTAVSDSSRRTRTVLTVQATNTGLAAARFKVVARECSPELPDLLNEKINKATDSFIVLPPKHTQSIVLDVPTEIPVDLAHCSVALINGEHQSVAVRDVTIRKGDRCFCVWHCECVCLGEDPKLLCREMPEARQIAAGLSLRERTRHGRSVCFPDMVSLNLCFAATGVITTLFLFGLVKACLGLTCPFIGSWGLVHIIQMPRKLDHYYELSLQGRPVVYDDEGWPLHPDTKERTVRLMSAPIEFILNTIFFITAPCVIVYDAIKQMFIKCKKPDSGSTKRKLNKTNAKTKNCYSSHDIQGTNGHWRRRRWRLQRWMSPEAEKLTSNVMQKGLPIRASMIRDTMRPLLREEFSRGDEINRPAMTHESCGNSEVDDTEYVLMQMQKSRESLARSQRKLNESVAAAAKKQ